jgi:hypothetical protein
MDKKWIRDGNKKAVVNLRLPELDRKALEIMAGKEDRTLSDMVRVIIHEAMRVRGLTPTGKNSNDLPAREQSILEFIRDYIQKNRFSPSYEEIGAACQISSKSLIPYYLDRLERKGRITKTPNRARSIVLVEQPTTPPAMEMITERCVDTLR